METTRLIVRRWNIYAEFHTGERRLLNLEPFVGTSHEANEEADMLIAELEGIETIECESLGLAGIFEQRSV